MSTDHGRFASADLDGLADSCNAEPGKPLHLLFVMDQRAKASNRPAAAFHGPFDHLNGAFDAEAKPVFVCK
jgi:hypothetical protein